MGKINSIFQGILLSTSIFLIYMVDQNLHALAEHNKNITILSEEISMERNYKEYNKVKSNNFITSFCNIKQILDNPLQFVLFFTYKNESLNLLDDVNVNKMIAFISHCSSKDIKNNLVLIEHKILNLFKDKNQTNFIAKEMLVSIIRRHNFDVYLHPQKLQKIIKDWLQINKFILEKSDIKESDLNTIVKFIMLYKLSEFLYV